MDRAQFLVMMFPVVLFAGCFMLKTEINEAIEEYTASFNYGRYVDGKENKNVMIKKGDKLFDIIYEWLMNNRNGWKKNYITYVPCHLFYSEEINININSDLVVVNYKDSKNKWKQIVHSQEKDELQIIKEK